MKEIKKSLYEAGTVLILLFSVYWLIGTMVMSSYTEERFSAYYRQHLPLPAAALLVAWLLSRRARRRARGQMYEAAGMFVLLAGAFWLARALLYTATLMLAHVGAYSLAFCKRTTANMRNYV